MERLRLRKIIQVSFVKSEETNFDEVMRSKEHRALIKSLKGNDCVCFWSQAKNQMVFVKGYTKMETKGKKPWFVLYSQRVRVKRGPGLSNEIEPKMLANYAREAGIELIGLKLFQEFYENLLETDARPKS